LSTGRRRARLLRRLAKAPVHASTWLIVGFSIALPAQEAKTPPQKSAASKPAPAPSTVVDDEFLEFLGSVDADDPDGDWMEYLAENDVVSEARAKKMPAPTEVKK
jgi:hypothetical protein